MDKGRDIADAEIARLLEAGDITGACAVAAKLPHPQHYRDAMVAINRIITNGMKGLHNMEQGTGREYSPQFELTEHKAKFSNLNTKPELHGDKPEPAADLSFILNMASTSLLPMLDPYLRGFLFCKHGAVQHDLHDMTADAPDLRFSMLVFPLKWALEFEATELRIHIGTGGKSDIVFPKAKISGFELTPKQGGTVVLKFQARVHPDEKQFGKIGMLMGADNLNISLEPAPEVDDLVTQGSAPAAATTEAAKPAEGSDNGGTTGATLQ